MLQPKVKLQYIKIDRHPEIENWPMNKEIPVEVTGLNEKSQLQAINLSAFLPNFYHLRCVCTSYLASSILYSHPHYCSPVFPFFLGTLLSSPFSFSSCLWGGTGFTWPWCHRLWAWIPPRGRTFAPSVCGNWDSATRALVRVLDHHTSYYLQLCTVSGHPRRS